MPDWLPVMLALVGSAALIQLITGIWVLTAAYAGAALIFALSLRALARKMVMPASEKLAPPDWSVTVTAIERRDMAIVITDGAGRVVCANTRYGEWFGYDSSPPQLELDEASVDRLRAAASEAWRSGITRAEGLVGTSGRWHADLRRAGRGQDYLVWELSPVEMVDLGARVTRLITDKLGRALTIAGIQAAAVNADGEILGANSDFARRAAGDAEAELAGREFVEFLTADEYDRIFYAREGTSGEDLRLVHLPIMDPDAPADDTQPSLFLILDGGMRANDSTALPEIEALLSLLPLGLSMTDRDGRFLFANKAFRRAAGLETHGEIPPFPSDLVVREDKGAFADAIRRHAAGSSSSGAMPIRLEANPDEPVTLSLAGVRGLGEAAVLLSLKDTTEETRLKRQVAQATKMQAVGQLAGGVAHDFNNVLTAIIGYCDLMLLRHAPGDSDYDDIQQIKANSNRAASLTRQLLAFSRQQTLRPQVLQMPDVVSEVSNLLKRLIGEKIQLKVSHDRALGAVRADPQQLEQVIINLAVNARDAMMSKGEDGGVLTISTRKIGPREVRALKNEVLPSGNYTALVVEDTGTGIPPEVLGKIFEPFYTTKEMGKGTGLGLSTVYGIVKQSGGFIFADSDPGKGARFSVYLPVHVAAPGSEPVRPKVEAEPRAAFGGTGAILLVEDEDTVRAVAERALTRQGYKVTTANDGEEGLQIVRDGGEFDLVISDVVMPTMDGPAMTKEILKLKPDLPVLFMSGYAEEQLRREIDFQGMHFLPKPFSVAQIGKKVGEILGERANAAKPT
ncbi:response regulator [Croceicoccus mobilis]|uniref:histidine kinase n=1 Tax=Croceicoccus mobilis TaxID=1703339 RepID=A0A917DYI5_9SPHN|nr:response regulator [Croceicoccus mobilis]GGD83722.1 signal transduction histidine kinase [Croceicoccus mobilis]